jgi:hypothetical protein
MRRRPSKSHGTPFVATPAGKPRKAARSPAGRSAAEQPACGLDRGSVAYVAWLLGHDPTRRVIVVSYSNDFAAELHRQFRMVIDAPWYRALFPGMRPAKDSGTELVTTVGGSRYATSVGGTPTGRGADLIIVDEEAMLELTRQSSSLPRPFAVRKGSPWRGCK